MRTEIQALRAIAVAAVVVYHVWPAALPGGFVGVDVFFAISGFLITAHLLREVERRGTVSLSGFWARRARRLLPAALLTLLCCTIATLALVPQPRWEQFLSEIAASTAYVQNWLLAGDAVDYLAADNDPSPVRHFWSLSVEEQFYVAWPVLILVAAAVTARRPTLRRTAIGAVLAVVAVASLAYSVASTAADPAAAYFVTPARAWEFAAGGLLALTGAQGSRAGPFRALLSWAGLAAIAAAAVGFDEGTPFPGWTALLPVLGTLAVIHAGAPAGRFAPTRLLELRPAQFLGGISYSVYLWHWPLLVLAPFVVANPAAPATRIAIVAMTVLVAWLSTRLVEDPLRSGSVLAGHRPRRTFATAAAATAVVAVALVVAGQVLEVRQRQAQEAARAVLADQPACFGAAARDPQRRCRPPSNRAWVAPAPIVAAREPNAPCARIVRDGPVSACEFGVPAARARRTVALVGDSHAAHWRAALQPVAERERWHAVSITRTSCPFSRATKDLDGRARARCLAWNDALPRWMARHPEIDMVFVAANTGGDVEVSTGMTMFETKVAGYRRAWRSLPRSVRRIVVIRDTPKVRTDTLDCVDRALDDGRRPASSCALPRTTALDRDPAAVAARMEDSRRVGVVDLTRVLCGPRLCHPVIGSALVYKDEHHLTRVFAATLGRIMQRRIARVTTGPRDERQRGPDRREAESAPQPRRSAAATLTLR